jgi:Type II CAAX prenyl endopeptidase Rce1-like
MILRLWGTVAWLGLSVSVAGVVAMYGKNWVIGAGLIGDGLAMALLRRHTGMVRAVVLSSVLFALAHATSYPLVSLPIPLVFGVIVCLLYQHTGSLLPGIALHSLINASVFEKAVTGNDRIVFPIFLTFGALFLIYGGLQRLYRFKGSAIVTSSRRVALSDGDSS